MTYTGRVIYRCDCGAACDEDGDGLWCPQCQAAVPLTDMYVDRESEPWF